MTQTEAEYAAMLQKYREDEIKAKAVAERKHRQRIARIIANGWVVIQGKRVRFNRLMIARAEDMTDRAVNLLCQSIAMEIAANPNWMQGFEPEIKEYQNARARDGAP